MISKGQQSTESVEFKKYIGVAPIKVLAINPTKAELSKIYDREFEEEPQYVKTDEDGVKSARIDFIVKTVEEKCDVNMIVKVSYFLRNEKTTGSNSGKIQVIDEYGRTAWVSQAEFDAKATLLQKNDGGTYQANITSNYRPTYGKDEESLCEFIKCWLNIPNVQKYNKSSKTWSLVDNPSECELRLDHIADYFNGNFSEIKSLMAFNPENILKILVGVKSADNGKQYQNVFTQMPLKNSISDYSKLDAAVKESQNAGAYSTTVFATKDICEYVVEETNFNEPQANTTSWFD